MSSVRKKVMTGTEFDIAVATVAEVYLRLPLYRIRANVFLHKKITHVFC